MPVAASEPAITFYRSNGNHDVLNGDDWRLVPAIEDAIARLARGSAIVGIIGPVGPAVVQAWQACVNLGHEPILLHVPTPKLSRVYWQSEMDSAIRTVGIGLLICADETCLPAGDLPHVLLSGLRPSSAPGDSSLAGKPGSFIQLSSGTTGNRKGIRFRLRDVEQHVAAYNQVLNLTRDDCIVSWLPLYHDMGFIAAFLMPRLLGCGLVLLDPIEWVAEPQMLSKAIVDHAGTICYMPNFGFEVMARRPASLPTVRKWISCSEPTRPATMRRFCEAMSVPPANFINCWGMAENIFAVTQAADGRTMVLDGVEIVSCGRPIPGVSVKTVDNELLVRSDYSIREYLGAPAELDAEGYYRTGDLGRIIDGEVYLQGRRQDLVNIGGRKFLLSDIDSDVAQEIPESAGRIAAFGELDPNIGTERLTVLIEHADFVSLNRQQDRVATVVKRCGIDSAEVQFVPPRFITKTSSGKINRQKTAEHWRLRTEARRELVSTAGAAERARFEITSAMPWLKADLPLNEQIDSLGYVNVSLVLERWGFAPNESPTASLDDILKQDAASGDSVRAVKIVLLCDSHHFSAIFEPTLRALAADNAVPVHIKHVCAPRAGILTSDIVFADYFMCRDRRPEVYSSMMRVIDDIKSADIVVVDDAMQVFWPEESIMVYPKVSHDFQADPRSKYLAVRWAAYSANHHEIACELVEHRLFDRRQVPQDLKALATMLDVPMIRCAYSSEYADVTGDWEIRLSATSTRKVVADFIYDGLDMADAQRRLREAILREIESLKMSPRPGKGSLNWVDQPHWCSWLINPELIDFVLDNFDTIAVHGKPSSVPYLAQAAQARGKRLMFRLDKSVPEECDCAVQTGYWGRPKPTDKPVIQLMRSGWGPPFAINLPPALAERCAAIRIERDP